MVESRIDCVACGSRRVKEVFLPPLSPGPVMVCSCCRLYFVDQNRLRNRNPSRNEIEFAARRNIEAYLSDIHTRSADFLRNAKQLRRFTKGQTLLDVGAYCGLFMKEAVKVGFDPVGVDPDGLAAAYGADMLGLKIVPTTLREAGFEKERFDVVTAYQVLEHTANPKSELLAIRRILKPWGVLSVEVPCCDSFLFRVMGKRHRHFAEQHLYVFSVKALCRLMDNCGFVTLAKLFPARFMSVRRVQQQVGIRNSRISKLTRLFVSDSVLGNHTLSMRVGDIIRVYAVKNSQRSS